MLMKRFPRLQLLNQKSTKKKIKVILAACGLHNICIMENDNVKFYIRKASQVLIILHPINIKNFVKIPLIRTIHNIKFEGHSKRLFFMQGMFSVHSLYFMDKLLLLIPAVSINSYYILVSLIIALREVFVAACLYFALLLGTSPSVFTGWRHKR